MLYKRLVFVDRFKEGLKLIGALKLIQMFPNEMLSKFTFQGELTAFLKPQMCVCGGGGGSEDLKQEDELLVKLLQSSLTQSGTQIL